MALFVTFEGIEGSGKTTQSRLLYEWLIDSGYEVVLTREPGGTPNAEKLREIILSVSEEKFPHAAELLLYMAARSFHVENLIKPALERGAVVICDRFSDATLAYQGFGRGIDIDFIKGLNDFVTDSVKPDITILIDIPVSVSIERLGDTRRDRMELEDRLFYERVRSGYLELSKLEPSRFVVIDGTLSVDAVFRRVVDCVRRRL